MCVCVRVRVYACACVCVWLAVYLCMCVRVHVRAYATQKQELYYYHLKFSAIILPCVWMSVIHSGRDPLPRSTNVRDQVKRDQAQHVMSLPEVSNRSPVELTHR